MPECGRHPRERWQAVTYKAEGRARPLGVADEGEVDTYVLEREDGALEFIEPPDLNDVLFENEQHREDAILPVRELHRTIHGEPYGWTGPDTVPVRIVADIQRDSVVGIEFPEPVGREILEELRLVRPPEDDDAGDGQ